ncbi:MAG: DNA repair protein RecO [Candidatus Arsenophonus melophagi]|nr:DNA repair protein RecO [Candidatus Arsenophonus melophagi]
MDSWQHAFVLHALPYSETSLLLDFFTEHDGRIRVLAKGARSYRSSLKGFLQLFTPLLIYFGGKGEIKTLYGAEPISLGLPLKGTVLYSGLYVNELLSRVLVHNMPYQGLFFDYLTCLKTLAKDELTSSHALRRFELSLLPQLGYGVDFLHCSFTDEAVIDSMTYRYCEEQGFIAHLGIDQLSFTGKQLKAFAYREFSDIDILSAAKRFTHIALKPYLGGSPLKSLELLPDHIA